VLETRRVLVTLKWPDFDSNTPILDAQVRAMRRIFGPDVDVSLTLEQADLALALGSYVGALWPIKVSHAQVPDGPRRMLAVAAILGAGGDLWREVSEWVKRELEPSEDNQATMLSTQSSSNKYGGSSMSSCSPSGCPSPTGRLSRTREIEARRRWHRRQRHGATAAASRFPAAIL
jgi:hypothetical protein